jgi:hypothetical protein
MRSSGLRNDAVCIPSVRSQAITKTQNGHVFALQYHLARAPVHSQPALSRPPPLGARARGRKPAAPAGLGALGSAWEWAAVFGLLRSLPYSPHCGTRTRTRPYKLQMGGGRHLNPAALPHGREPPASPSPSPAASRRLHSSRSEIPRSEVESGKMRSTAGIRPFWMCRT